MSCTEVMYQPYSPYFPYPQRSSLSSGQLSGQISATQTLSSVASSVSKEESSAKTVSTERTSSSTSTGGSQSQSTGGGLRDSAADAQYISSNCVIFTYFSGDTSAIVDEHFARALSHSGHSTNEKSNKDGGPPMSHRSFPPSFWNINHQPAHHHPSHASGSGLCIPQPGSSSANAAQVHELYASAAAADPYHHPGALHPATIHHQNDPWHYTFSASAAGNPYTSHHHHHHHHRAAAAASAAIHDLGYSSASNRFNAQYSSLLLQPASMRSTRLTPVSAPCSGFDKTAPDMAWPSTARYHHEGTMNFAGHPIDPSYTATTAYGAAMSAAMSDTNNMYELYKLSATCMRSSYR